MGSQNLKSLTLRAGDFSLAPRRGSPGILVLDEQMGAADFALEALLRGGAVGSLVLRVVLAHVVLQGFAVGLGWRLPARFLGAGVEVVGQVLAVGVPDFPAWWEACCLINVLMSASCVMGLLSPVVRLDSLPWRCRECVWGTCRAGFKTGVGPMVGILKVV
jgi:hypothetical protein